MYTHCRLSLTFSFLGYIEYLEHQAVEKIDQEKKINQLEEQVRAEQRDNLRLVDVELLQAEATKFNNTIATMDRSNRESREEIQRLRNKIKRLEGR